MPLQDFGRKIISLLIRAGSLYQLYSDLVVPCAENPTAQLCVVVSLSHYVGDGHTFYALHNMLQSTMENKIEKMDVSCVDRTADTQALLGPVNFEFSRSKRFFAHAVGGFLWASPSRRTPIQRYLIVDWCRDGYPEASVCKQLGPGAFRVDQRCFDHLGPLTQRPTALWLYGCQSAQSPFRTGSRCSWKLSGCCALSTRQLANACPHSNVNLDTAVASQCHADRCFTVSVGNSYRNIVHCEQLVDIGCRQRATRMYRRLAFAPVSFSAVALPPNMTTVVIFRAGPCKTAILVAGHLSHLILQRADFESGKELQA